MYFSEFHKQIFKAIEKEEIQDLESFLEKFVNVLSKYKGKLYCDGKSIGFKDSIFEDFTFSGLETNIDGSEKFVVTTKENEEDIYILFQELVMILDFLEANSLITLKEKDGPRKKCLAIYKLKKDTTTEKNSIPKVNEYEPFDDVLMLINKYLNKRIIVRSGFTRFTKDRYKTPEDKMKLLSTIKIPIIALALSIFIAPFIKVIIDNYFVPRNSNSLPVLIKSFPIKQLNQTDSTVYFKADSLVIYAIYKK